MGAKTGYFQEFSPSEIEVAVSPMLLQPLSSEMYSQLANYLHLLSHWNEKINLTAVRNPEILVGLHLAECLRAAQRIPVGVETVLDFGSGAGFPGIPIQIARPELRVTLAESQNKKAAFLREVVRGLGLSVASIHAGRVEEMPGSSIFDLATLRAVDKMEEAMKAALHRIWPPHESRQGWYLVLTSQSEASAVISASDAIDWELPEPIPGTDQRVILRGSRIG